MSQADFAGRPGPTRFAAAAFSRDGTKLAFNHNFAIWISPSNGGAPAKLTSESGEFAAEWSPDGAWIAFNFLCSAKASAIFSAKSVRVRIRDVRRDRHDDLVLGEPS